MQKEKGPEYWVLGKPPSTRSRLKKQEVRRECSRVSRWYYCLIRRLRETFAWARYVRSCPDFERRNSWDRKSYSWHPICVIAQVLAPFRYRPHFSTVTDPNFPRLKLEALSAVLPAFPSLLPRSQQHCKQRLGNSDYQPTSAQPISDVSKWSHDLILRSGAFTFRVAST